jgi:hypothetical protein
MVVDQNNLWHLSVYGVMNYGAQWKCAAHTNMLMAGRRRASVHRKCSRARGAQILSASICAAHSSTCCLFPPHLVPPGLFIFAYLSVMLWTEICRVYLFAEEFSSACHRDINFALNCARVLWPLTNAFASVQLRMDFDRESPKKKLSFMSFLY